MRSSVQVSAGARLHFGLARLSQREGPSFGGLGMMIERPRVAIHLQPSVRWRHGAANDCRCVAVCRRAMQAWNRDRLTTAVEVCCVEQPPLHRGLGSGTQLALAAAAGVRNLLELPPAPIDELAYVAGRGARSAVGAHGFVKGGLIWETGRMPGDRLGRLGRRVAVPAAWRIVLAIPHREEGLSGPSESAAFARLPAPDAAVTDRLYRLAEEEVLPAARRRSFHDFSEAVYQYCRTSGTIFAPVQGGDYASAAIAARIKSLQEMGVVGVGQSSWGPTVFAMTPSQDAAIDLTRRLRRVEAFTGCDLTITAADNHAARFVAGARQADFAAS